MPPNDVMGQCRLPKTRRRRQRRPSRCCRCPRLFGRASRCGIAASMMRPARRNSAAVTLAAQSEHRNSARALTSPLCLTSKSRQIRRAAEPIAARPTRSLPTTTRSALPAAAAVGIGCSLRRPYQRRCCCLTRSARNTLKQEENGDTDLKNRSKERL